MLSGELKQLGGGKVSVFGNSKVDPVTKTGPNVAYILFAVGYAM